MLIDIHTHLSDTSSTLNAIVNCEPNEFRPVDGQLYSVGVHPWTLGEGREVVDKQTLLRVASHPQVVAIGESGIDLLRGGVLFQQMLVFRQAVEVSEELSKPLIIHCVKAHDIIAQLRREMKPRMDWIIHGFRGKPTVAQILLQSGCSLSYGEQFNPESLAVTPLDRLYAETDTSMLSIDAIVQALSASRGVDLTQTVIDNVARLL